MSDRRVGSGRVSARLDPETTAKVVKLMAAYGKTTQADLVRTAIDFLWKDTFGPTLPGH